MGLSFLFSLLTNVSQPSVTLGEGEEGGGKKKEKNGPVAVSPKSRSDERRARSKLRPTATGSRVLSRWRHHHPR